MFRSFTSHKLQNISKVRTHTFIPHLREKDIEFKYISLRNTTFPILKVLKRNGHILKPKILTIQFYFQFHYCLLCLLWLSQFVFLCLYPSGTFLFNFQSFFSCVSKSPFSLCINLFIHPAVCLSVSLSFTHTHSHMPLLRTHWKPVNLKSAPFIMSSQWIINFGCHTILIACIFLKFFEVLLTNAHK